MTVVQQYMQLLGVNGLGDIFRGVGIGTLVLASLYVVIKFKVVDIVSVQEGTRAARSSWGRAKYHRYEIPAHWAWAERWHWSRRMKHRKGRLVVLGTGRHLVIRGLHGLIVINLRDIPSDLPQRNMAFKRRTLIFDGTLVWRIHYEDSEWGDQCLYNSIWSVRDTNVHDQDISHLTQKVLSLVMNALRLHLPVTTADQEGFPLVTVGQLSALCGDELITKHGVELVDFLPAPMSWTEAQIRADAEVSKARILAKAIRRSNETRKRPRLSSLPTALDA
jgi:hypothetical protein